MDILIMQLFNGLSLSSILLLVGLGLSITFGIMGIINLFIKKRFQGGVVNEK